MSRLRYNGLSTTLGGSLTNVATSVTFAAALTHSNGTNVPTIVSPDYIPLAILGATGHLSEIVYLTAYTAGATTGTITRGVEGTTGAAHSNGDALTQAPLAADIEPYPAIYQMPTNSKAETVPRSLVGSTASPTSGVLRLVGISLLAGTIINKIAFMSGSTAAVTPTHWWFGLYDQNRVQLATTADQLTTAWAANTLQELPIATVAGGSASSFTTTYTGLHYLGISTSAGTNPTLQCFTAISTGPVSLAPILCGTSTAGVLTPQTFPFTANALAAISQVIYAFVE